MVIDHWSNLLNYQTLLPQLEVFVPYLNQLESLEEGKYELEDGHFFVVMSGDTQLMDEGLFEFHQAYVDVQIVLEGQEQMQWGWLPNLCVTHPYDNHQDIGFAQGNGTIVTVSSGMFYMAFPHDAHMPARHVNESTSFKKVVLKIKL